MPAAVTRPTAVIVEGEGAARAPMVAGAGVPVAAIVRCRARAGHRRGAGALGGAGLDRAALEPILTYCAERRCEADDATCPGCRLRTEKLGIATFDDFVARYAEIASRTRGLRIRAAAAGTLAADSLEHLAKTWAGEEYWFWARRVLRKLRHGIRRAGQSGAPPEAAAQPPVLILVRPQLADNIGMVARAMANFGLEDLRLVEPRDGWPNEKARIAASGANFIIDGARPIPASRTRSPASIGSAPPRRASATSPSRC